MVISLTRNHSIKVYHKLNGGLWYISTISLYSFKSSLSNFLLQCCFLISQFHLGCHRQLRTCDYQVHLNDYTMKKHQSELFDSPSLLRKKICFLNSCPWVSSYTYLFIFLIQVFYLNSGQIKWNFYLQMKCTCYMRLFNRNPGVIKERMGIFQYIKIKHLKGIKEKTMNKVKKKTKNSWVFTTQNKGLLSAIHKDRLQNC